jgi:hypothetical protein
LKVSVVIPLFNKARHIARAVNSVYRQTWQADEIIIVDDGSTDGSDEVVRRIADARLRLITQPNAGECAARNRGIAAATHDLVAFLDADDEWLPVFLQTVAGLRQKYPECGIYATAYSMCREGVTLKPHFQGCPASPTGGMLADYFKSTVAAPPVTSSSAMIPKRALQEISGFPVGVKRGGDLATWARIALQFRIAWSPIAGAIYHLSADNRACDIHPAHHDVPGAGEIERCLEAGSPTACPRESISEYLAFMRLTIARHCCLIGQRGLARELLTKTRGTVAHASVRRSLVLLSSLPPSLLTFLVDSKASCRRALNSLSSRRKELGKRAQTRPNQCRGAPLGCP